MTRQAGREGDSCLMNRNFAMRVWIYPSQIEWFQQTEPENRILWWLIFIVLRNMCLRTQAAWVKGMRVSLVRSHRRLRYNGTGVADWVIWPSRDAGQRILGFACWVCGVGSAVEVSGGGRGGMWRVWSASIGWVSGGRHGKRHAGPGGYHPLIAPPRFPHCEAVHPTHAPNDGATVCAG